MADEIDVIQHLLDVEREADLVIQDAQKEADSRIAQARAKADTQFKTQYTQMYAQLEQEAQEQMKQAGVHHDTEVASFKDSLQSTPKNNAAFNSLMDSILFR